MNFPVEQSVWSHTKQTVENFMLWQKGERTQGKDKDLVCSVRFNKLWEGPKTNFPNLQNKKY